MACNFCGKEEKSPSADKESVLLCSKCVAFFSTLDRDKMRELIDLLYLSDRVAKAEILEHFVLGPYARFKSTPAQLKVRTVSFKGLKPRSRGLFG